MATGIAQSVWRRAMSGRFGVGTPGGGERSIFSAIVYTVPEVRSASCAKGTGVISGR